ncbi:phage tail protein [Photobacterium atrarenae]|uniref:Phage tail protein n=1 Tax=Photobacterium atrarenae TaxID=865757 RepID=A0ABY5GIF6_9GAMM|nr:phage tail protein [Photobacterium atrarenae]UTV28997.1 phage tail protein [Photobacterium atrarenae]
MNQMDRELVQAVKNLSSLQESAVPKASAMAINRVATRAVSRSVKDTAKTVRIKQKVIRPRATIKKASGKMPVAYVRVRRFDVPAISIATARTQIRRKKGRMQVSGVSRNSRGRFSQRQHSGNTAIVVGRHKFANAFLQRLKNGRWHIMQRTSDSRYPIQVCKVPIVNEITRAFKHHSQTLMKTDMPKELSSAMGQQIRLIVRREVGRGH